MFSSSVGLTFDDILLAPRKSSIKTRKECSLSTWIGPYCFSLPIVSSPMDTVTEAPMAIAMAKAGGLGIIHRGQTIDSQVAQVRNALTLLRAAGHSDKVVGAAIGTKPSELMRAQELIIAGAEIICIDVSHGHHDNVALTIKQLKKNFPTLTIIAGNIATADGARFLANEGVSAIRVGIGNGSICSTRLNCGHGVPQVMAITSAASAVRHTRLPSPGIISDGGCKTPGDILKALALGSDMVMLGSMLAGTDSSPGEVIVSQGKSWKAYRGMASKDSQKDWAGAVKSIEGISAMIPYKGPVSEVLKNLSENLKAGLSYSGVTTIQELQKHAEFVRISSSSVIESSTHILERGLLA